MSGQLIMAPALRVFAVPGRGAGQAGHSEDAQAACCTGRLAVGPSKIIWFGITFGLMTSPAAQAVLLICLQFSGDDF